MDPVVLPKVFPQSKQAYRCFSLRFPLRWIWVPWQCGHPIPAAKRCPSTSSQRLAGKWELSLWSIVVRSSSSSHWVREERRPAKACLFMHHRNFSKKGGTRPPSPREVNSRGSSPAVGRFAPSGLPSLFPRLSEMMLHHHPVHNQTATS